MPSRHGVDDPGESLRRERRRFIRDHHPDRGGDPEAFIVGLQQRGITANGGPSPRVVFYRRPRGVRRVVVATKHLIHRTLRHPKPHPRVR